MHERRSCESEASTEAFKNNKDLEEHMVLHNKKARRGKKGSKIEMTYEQTTSRSSIEMSFSSET